MTVALAGCFDFDLKDFVYSGLKALMENYALSELIQDQDLLRRLAEFSQHRSVTFKKSTALDPGELPAVAIATAPGGTTQQFIGHLLEDEEGDGEEFPAHWGELEREAVSVDIVTAQSGLRDDLYRLVRMLLVLLAATEEAREESPLQNIRVQSGGEGHVERDKDPLIIYGATLYLSAEFAIGFTDVADKVHEIAVTISPAS